MPQLRDIDWSVALVDGVEVYDVFHQDVHSLSVAGYSTFHVEVGNEQVLVHNSKCDKGNTPAPQTTRVHRVESPGNARLDIDPGGGVLVKGDNTLFLNFGDAQRATSVRDRRLAQGYPGTEIKSFDVPTSYVDGLRATAVPESFARQFPDSPLVVDVNKAADQFGLRGCHLPALTAVIIPGSGRSGC